MRKLSREKLTSIRVNTELYDIVKTLLAKECDWWEIRTFADLLEDAMNKYIKSKGPPK